MLAKDHKSNCFQSNRAVTAFSSPTGITGNMSRRDRHATSDYKIQAGF